jgi:hypothetical protein
LLHDELKHLLVTHLAVSPLADLHAGLKHHNAVSKNVGEWVRDDVLSYALPLHGLEQPHRSGR